jgi:hypothetical protein
MFKHLPFPKHAVLRQLLSSLKKQKQSKKKKITRNQKVNHHKTGSQANRFRAFDCKTSLMAAEKK